MLQCGQEYVVANECEDARATEVLKLTTLELIDLDPNNLDC